MISVTTLLPIEVFLQTVIIKEYLQSTYCVSIISDSPLNVNFLVPFTYINFNGAEDFNDRLLQVSEKGCSDYIIKIQEPNIFMTVFENVTHIGNARRSDKKLIFLASEENDNNDNLLDVLSMKETGFVANVLLILPDNSHADGCTSYNLVTHKFVGSDEEVSSPIYLDKWNSCVEKFEKNANLFPHDMTNLYGKTVKVSCFTYKPYVFLDLDTRIISLGRDGTEVRIVEEFCR